MILDITQPLRPDMPLYPGTPPFERDEYRQIAKGDTSTNAKFSVGAHVGTHVDAPSHYVDNGPGMETLSPDLLVGPCRVFDLRGRPRIDAADLEALPLEGVTRALFRTDTSDHMDAFDTGFVALTGPGAELLVARGVRLVGLDAPSADVYKAPGHPAHHALLGAGVVIIEGLDLSKTEPGGGDYELICAPLLIPGGEAAPARVFLRR
jgi:arylformamidase